MTRDKQKKNEGLVRHFLGVAGYQTFVAQGGDRPDAEAHCRVDGNNIWLGIEFTDYYGDAEAGWGSRAQRINTQWSGIWRDIGPTVVADPLLSQFDVQLIFGKGWAPSKLETKDIGDEILNFVRRYAGREGRKFPGALELWELYTHENYFDQFPLLKKYCQKIYLTKRISDMPPTWGWNNDAILNVNPKQLAAIIHRKSKKGRKFDWRDVDRKWLVIIAGTGVATSLLGPYDAQVDQALHSPQVMQAAERSVFDRVVLWERFCGWVEDIFPRKGRMA